MTRKIIFAMLVGAAGCELCDHLDGPPRDACEQALQTCDLDGDGDGDAAGTCDANQLCWVPGHAPGACV